MTPTPRRAAPAERQYVITARVRLDASEQRKLFTLFTLDSFSFATEQSKTAAKGYSDNKALSILFLRGLCS